MARVRGSTSGEETILLVEDEELVRDVFERTLIAQGYHVLLAEDGADALDVAAEHNGDIDLLITDVVMPNMGGEQLAQRITADRPGLRVLMASGYAESDLGRSDGSCHAFLRKPCSPSELGQRVRELLDA